MKEMGGLKQAAQNTPIVNLKRGEGPLIWKQLGWNETYQTIRLKIMYDSHHEFEYELHI